MGVKEKPLGQFKQPFRLVAVTSSLAFLQIRDAVSSRLQDREIIPIPDWVSRYITSTSLYVFSGTVLALLTNDPTDKWKRGRVLARLANGFPHRFAHGDPIRDERRWCRGTPPVPRRMLSPVSSRGKCRDDASPIPLTPTIQVRDPLYMALRSPAEGLSFSRSLVAQSNCFRWQGRAARMIPDPFRCGDRNR